MPRKKKSRSHGKLSDSFINPPPLPPHSTSSNQKQKTRKKKTKRSANGTAPPSLPAELSTDQTHHLYEPIPASTATERDISVSRASHAKDESIYCEFDKESITKHRDDESANATLAAFSARGYLDIGRFGEESGGVENELWAPWPTASQEVDRTLEELRRMQPTHIDKLSSQHVFYAAGVFIQEMCPSLMPAFGDFMASVSSEYNALIGSRSSDGAPLVRRSSSSGIAAQNPRSRGARERTRKATDMKDSIVIDAAVRALNPKSDQSRATHWRALPELSRSRILSIANAWNAYACCSRQSLRFCLSRRVQLSIGKSARFGCNMYSAIYQLTHMQRNLRRLIIHHVEDDLLSAIMALARGMPCLAWLDLCCDVKCMPTDAARLYTQENFDLGKEFLGKYHCLSQFPLTNIKTLRILNATRRGQILHFLFPQSLTRVELSVHKVLPPNLNFTQGITAVSLLPNLRDLTLSNFCEPDFDGVFSKMTSLKRLSFIGSVEKASFGGLSRLLQHTTSTLQSLYIADIQWTAAVLTEFKRHKHLRALRELHILPSSSSLNFECFALVESFALDSVILEFSDFVSFLFIRATYSALTNEHAVHRLSHLHTLRALECYATTDDAIDSLLACTNLRSLELRNCSMSAARAKQLRSLPNLTQFIVSAEQQIEMKRLENKSYYFGAIPRGLAETLLHNSASGTYLVRFSQKTSKLVVSGMIEGGFVHHVLVCVTPVGVCWVHGSADEDSIVCQSVDELIELHSKSYHAALSRKSVEQNQSEIERYDPYVV